MPPEDPAELADAWRDELDLYRVHAAVLIASVPGDEESIAAAVARHRHRIIGAFMVDPTQPDTEVRVQRAFDEQGLKICCLFPAMHRYSVAECEGVRAIASLAASRPGTAVFTHFGALSVGIRARLGLPSRFDMRCSNPVDLHPVAAEFARARFIIPHFGAGLLREALLVADLCPNVYLDTSSTNKWMRYQSAKLTLADVFSRARAVVGYERLLFGTDSSFFPRGWQGAVLDAQVAALVEIGASVDEAQAILGGNLASLLMLA
jgi:predicted TIM-barrel fold metal-dependent hydrolase